MAIIGTRGYPSYYGGFETAVRKLAPFLADAGWDVTVYGRPGATKTTDPTLDPRIHTRVTRGLETKSLSTLTFGLTSCLDAMVRKPDVAVVMNVANGFWLPLLWMRGVPTLVNVDGIEWDRAKWGRVAKWVFRTGARATAKFGNRLVFDSIEISKRWASEFRRDGDFIPYGGDEPDTLPLEQGLIHRGYVLMVARFVPENTVREFLQAAEALSKRWNVVIVGSSGYGGELDESAAALAEGNDSVRWLGHLSDDARLLSLWQHAGVYFHGHSVGGTNPALVQAMACGAPIVARDTIYNREVLGVDGVFTAPEADHIEATVDGLMKNPELQEFEARRVALRAREHYSWRDVCTKYATSMLLLANAKRVRR
ncbi:glycosyltransferase [Cryobacterium zongtaii]|uniref:glycosyltransferase n=1 Tax=Cryobacterium zongtaii TaxID=1259217 RepID=UPI001FB002BE|nr:glycosyltransferase [Cryobacterium zongtaii]